MNVKNYDLVIVGGGILGTFHAYFALQAGLKVALLERHGTPRGATVRNFGQIVPSGMNTYWREIGRESLVHYKLLQQETDITLRQEGSLYLASEPAEVRLLEELEARVDAEGYGAELLEPADCARKCPGVRKDYALAGLYFPEEISLDPRIAVHRIREHLVRQYGLAYYPRTRATDLSAPGEEVTTLTGSGDVLRSDRAIVCGGDEVETLFPRLFERADLVISQLQMLRLAPQRRRLIGGNLLTGRTVRRYESFRECPSYASAMEELPRDTFADRYGIHLLFKQADDGSVILGDSHQYAPATDDRNLPFDRLESVDEAMLREARRICELDDWTVTHRWMGRYLQCEKADLFESTVEGRIHLVTGIGGKGMTAGPGYSRRSIERIYAPQTQSV